MDLSQRNAAACLLVVAVCMLMASCTSVDMFAIQKAVGGSYRQDLRSFTGYMPGRVAAAAPGAQIAMIHTIYRKPVSVKKPQLVLRQPCEYLAGSDIAGRLPKGPLEADATGIPASSNARIKRPIHLIQVGDLAVEQKYDIKSYIGVTQDGTFLPNIILHSDVPGAPKYASENASIRFTPKDCRYSTEMIEAQEFVRDPSIAPSDAPLIYRGPTPDGLRFTRGNDTVNAAESDGRVVPAKPGKYRLYGLGIRIIGVSGPRITYAISGPDQ